MLKVSWPERPPTDFSPRSDLLWIAASAASVKTIAKQSIPTTTVLDRVIMFVQGNDQRQCALLSCKSGFDSRLPQHIIIPRRSEVLLV